MCRQAFLVKSSEQSTAKALLSDTEVEELLALFTPAEEKRGAADPFERGIKRAAGRIKSYLKSRGLPFGQVELRKGAEAVEADYCWQADGLYLEGLVLDNALALGVLAADLGALEPSLTLRRPLTSLEKILMERVARTVMELVEKELAHALRRDDVLARVDDYTLYLSQGGERHRMQLLFSAAAAEPAMPKTTEGTPVEALVGKIAAATLEKGRLYKVEGFGRGGTVLLLEQSLPFRAKRSEKPGETVRFVLQEAISDRALLSGYTLSVAGALLDDDALLSLEHGSVLSLTPYRDVLVHKDGRITAKAKLLLHKGEIAAKIV